MYTSIFKSKQHPSLRLNPQVSQIITLKELRIPTVHRKKIIKMMISIKKIDVKAKIPESF